MNTYSATVVKTGNSLALRVPKQYALAAGIKAGDKVELPLPVPTVKQDRRLIESLIARLQQIHALHSINDPVAWQREERRDRHDPSRY